MSEKGWKDIPTGGVIEEAGNAETYETGSWRTYRPMWNEETCIHCLRCWVACPDSSIKLADGKVTSIHYAHFKGCGICSFECPTDPKTIEMKLDTDVED